MRWLDGMTESKDMNLSKFHEIEEDRGSGVLWSMVLQRVRYDLVAEKQQYI